MFTKDGWMADGDDIATIVQGRYDIVCAPQNAWDLHTAWPGSRLIWIADAGHSATVSIYLCLCLCLCLLFDVFDADVELTLAGTGDAG
jgi:hypothetical protein